MRFSIAARLKSFSFAFAGVAYMLRTQHNAWLHLIATIAVIAAGFALNVSADDWRWLVAAIVLVWTAETVNTAFEHLCDVVSPDCLGAEIQGHRRRRGADLRHRRCDHRRAGVPPVPRAALNDEANAGRDQTMRLTRDAPGSPAAPW